MLVPCSHSCRGIIWGKIGNPYSFSICSICSGKHSRITLPSALPSPLQILHLIDRLGALPRALSGRCPARRSSGPGGRTPRSPGESPSARPAARRQQCQGRRLWARTAPAANPASTSHCVASVCQSSAEVAVPDLHGWPLQLAQEPRGCLGQSTRRACRGRSTSSEVRG